MNTQPPMNYQPQFPIEELEEIDAVINASERLIATLQRRRETMAADLERITRPTMAALLPVKRKIGPGLAYKGAVTQHWNFIDIHIDLLRRLWLDFPEQRAAMAEAVSKYGSTRRYVATSREALFPGQMSWFAVKHSRQLVDGWYVDTNLGRERMSRILPAAVKVVGLTWGIDVQTYWRPTVIS